MFGPRITQLRKARGLTQLQLAHKTGLALNTLSRMERGEVDNPNLSTLQALGRALDVSLDELVAEPDWPEPADLV